ncbi:MAG: class I SAM-dependent methyltransferase [Acidobacteriota bacterium]
MGIGRPDIRLGELKQQVREFWNASPCGTEVSLQEKLSQAYFEDIESYRYESEPQIFAFAQFSRFFGKKVLEVGVGAGTDFLQWVRSGARAYGVDLTSNGVEHVRKRLELYGLQAEELRVADCENLPYGNDEFDLVYSWGVIHHTPDTEKALREIVRVVRPGGLCKIMVYHRHSLAVLYLWLKQALLRMRPWKSPAWCLAHYQESPGTKAYTRRELAALLSNLPLQQVRIRTWLTYCDTLEKSRKPSVRLFGKACASLFGRDRFGWFLTAEFRKVSHSA